MISDEYRWEAGCEGGVERRGQRLPLRACVEPQGERRSHPRLVRETFHRGAEKATAGTCARREAVQQLPVLVGGQSRFPRALGALELSDDHVRRTAVRDARHPLANIQSLKLI